MNDLKPTVDVIIPVHAQERPIRRAVASVLLHTAVDVRVTVVAHGLDPQLVEDALHEFRDDARLRIVPFVDGVRSPAGPMNHGLELATGEFISLLGSDDEFASGAIDNWLDVQRRFGASVVIARVDMVGGATQPHPPVRPTRSGICDAARDRLAYRTAPLGLVSRKDFGELRFTENLETGEDIAYSLRLWFAGKPIVFERSFQRGYLGHSDATDRVTAVKRALHKQLAAIELIIDSGDVFEVSAAAREAIVVKLFRVQILGALATRKQLDSGETEFLRQMCRGLLKQAPRALGVLSVAEARLLRVALSGRPLVRAATTWSRKFRPIGVLTKNPLRFFHAQAPLRFGIASLIVSRAGRK